MLRAEHLRVAKLVAADESRYALGNIRVSPADVRVTDASLLLLAEHKSLELNAMPPIGGVTATAVFEPFLLAREDALKIAAAIPRGRVIRNVPACACAQVGAESTADKAVIGTTDLVASQVFQPRKNDGQFPSFVQPIPRIADATVVISVDPRLLAKLMAQMSDLLGSEALQLVTMRVYDARSGIRFDARNGEGEAIVGVLMPMQSPAVSNEAYPKAE